MVLLWSPTFSFGYFIKIIFYKKKICVRRRIAHKRDMKLALAILQYTFVCEKGPLSVASSVTMCEGQLTQKSFKPSSFFVGPRGDFAWTTWTQVLPSRETLKSTDSYWNLPQKTNQSQTNSKCDCTLLFAIIYYTLMSK